MPMSAQWLIIIIIFVNIIGKQLLAGGSTSASGFPGMDRPYATERAWMEVGA